MSLSSDAYYEMVEEIIEEVEEAIETAPKTPHTDQYSSHVDDRWEVGAAKLAERIRAIIKEHYAKG